MTGLLTKAGGGPFAALFRCNLGGPGRQTRVFLKFALSHYSDTDFSDLAFSSLYRFHVAESPLGAANDQLYCKCGFVRPMLHDPSHPWHCRMHSGPCIRRHDKIVKHFQKFIKEVRPSAVVEVEPPLGIDTYCRADLRVADGIRSMLIDVVCTDSCNLTSIQHAHTHMDPDASTRKSVARKNAKYNGLLASNPEIKHHVYPVAFCDSGRFGEEARVVVEILGAKHKRAKAKLYENVGRECNHAGGKMMSDALTLLTTTRPFHAHDGAAPMPPPPDDADDTHGERRMAYTNSLRESVRRGITTASSGGPRASSSSSSSSNGGGSSSSSSGSSSRNIRNSSTNDSRRGFPTASTRGTHSSRQEGSSSSSSRNSRDRNVNHNISRSDSILSHNNSNDDDYGDDYDNDGDDDDHDDDHSNHPSDAVGLVGGSRPYVARHSTLSDSRRSGHAVGAARDDSGDTERTATMVKMMMVQMRE